jgi:hypothetical protein
MKIKYSCFQRNLKDALCPGAFSLDVHNEQDAIHKAMQIAIDGKNAVITILFVYEDDKPSCAHSICGWKKGASGTVKSLPQKDVENYFSELEAVQKVYRLPQ